MYPTPKTLRADFGRIICTPRSFVEVPFLAGAAGYGPQTHSPSLDSSQLFEDGEVSYIYYEGQLESGHCIEEGENHAKIFQQILPVPLRMFFSGDLHALIFLEPAQLGSWALSGLPADVVRRVSLPRTGLPTAGEVAQPAA